MNRKAKTFYDPKTRLHYSTLGDFDSPIKKPKLRSPINGKGDKGNLPYMRFRRRLRREMLR